jgi:hypothetical protein
MKHRHARRHRHHHHLFHDPALAFHGPDLSGAGATLRTLTLAIVAGAALGAAVLLLLRRRSLRWSWALIGLPLTWCLWWVDWRIGLSSLAATSAAAGLGAYTHHEVSRHGGEEGRRMAEAPGPARWAFAKLSNRRALESRVRSGTLAIGTARRGAVCRVPFGSGHGVHALVAGATGSGKTVTQAAIAEAYIDAGMAAIVVDPKGDPQLRLTLEAAARRRGTGFRAWSPTGPYVYNPLARGGPTEIVDKALAAHRWSEPHYELATQRLLGHVLTTMQLAGRWPPTISGVVENMNPTRLDSLAHRAGGPNAERVSSYVDGLTARSASDLGGGRDRLAVLAEGELGPRLDPALGEGEVLDLEAGLRAGEVLYFNLDADRYPAASKLLSAALLIDLVGLTAAAQQSDLRALLVIDEFAALAAEQVSRLFARARSAGRPSRGSLRHPDRAGALEHRVRRHPPHRRPRFGRTPRPARRHGPLVDDDPAGQRTRDAVHHRRGDPDPRARVPDRPGSVQAARHRRGGRHRPEGKAPGRDRPHLAAERGRAVSEVELQPGPPASPPPILAPSSLAASPFGARAGARPRLRLGFRSRRPARFGGCRSRRGKDQR